MGRPLEKTCRICLKTMKSDHLKIHMTQHVGDVQVSKKRKSSECEISAKCTNINVEKLEREYINHMNEFEKKLSLGEI